MDPISVNQLCHLAAVAAASALGQRLAATLLKRRREQRALASQLAISAELPGEKGGQIVDLLLLQGDLGAGKTCLVQGLAAGLGIEEPITSPTFALAQHYAGAVPPPDPQQAPIATALVHLDLYRLEQPAAADELLAQEEEEAAALGAVLAVEWPERLSFRPEGVWWVELGFEQDGRWARLRIPEHPGLKERQKVWGN